MSCRGIWQPAASMLLERLRHNVPMKNYTTMGVGGPALALAQPDNAEELAAVLKVCRDNGLPYYLMGAGSNLIFLDEGYEGVVIKLGRAFKKLEFGPQGILTAGASASLAGLVEAATEKGLSGLECLAGIPGTVGGAVWMNAGSFGRSVGQVTSRVAFVDGEGRRGDLRSAGLEFSYRRLRGLPEKAIIVEAEFQLEAGPAEEIKAAVRGNLETRAQRHPKGLRSAGSVFKNPPDQPAGRIIEACGLKGLTIGGAQVSEKHANFIVNPGGEATASDILALVERIIGEVRRQRGLTLEPEIKIIGARGEVKGYEDI